MDDVPIEVTSGLIDRSELDPDDLETLDNPVLASALAMICDDLAHSDQAISRFDSSL